MIITHRCNFGGKKGTMTTTQDKIEFDQVIERGCGIDIHKSVLVSTVQGKGIKTATRIIDAMIEGEGTGKVASWKDESFRAGVNRGTYRQPDRTP